MSKNLDCPVCGNDSGVEGTFDSLGTVHKCEYCGAEIEVAYDETYDGEEEYGWFYLERTAPPDATEELK